MTHRFLISRDSPVLYTTLPKIDFQSFGLTKCENSCVVQLMKRAVRPTLCCLLM